MYCVFMLKVQLNRVDYLFSFFAMVDVLLLSGKLTEIPTCVLVLKQLNTQLKLNLQ